MSGRTSLNNDESTKASSHATRRGEPALRPSRARRPQRRGRERRALVCALIVVGAPRVRFAAQSSAAASVVVKARVVVVAVAEEAEV
mmetsp:Transcript_18270/g.56899  ORF Transcript_18270/g.56899 Transcript_18270/m.56899 type:complete len:87 (+) Transcript_18270:390-650(+)